MQHFVGFTEPTEHARQRTLELAELFTEVPIGMVHAHELVVRGPDGLGVRTWIDTEQLIVIERLMASIQLQELLPLRRSQVGRWLGAGRKWNGVRAGALRRRLNR